MATTVAFSELDTWLRSQPLNSSATPYEIEITGLTAEDLGERTTSGSLGYILYQNYNKYVDLSNTTLPVVTSLLHSFLNCSNIVKPPIIPEGVQSIYDAFAGCTNLTEITLPTTINDIRNAFSNCTNLSKIKWNINDSMVIRTNSEYAFEYCSNLTDFYCDSPHTIKDYLTEISTSARLPTSVSSCNFYLFSEMVEIPFSSLNDELGALSTNTTSTPYKIKVTGLTVFALEYSYVSGSLGYILIHNSNKYVDLSETIIPSAITSLNQVFKDCTTLVYAPTMPETLTFYMENFSGCTALKEVNYIQFQTDTAYEFTGCTSLEVVRIKHLVTTQYDPSYGIESPFYGCTSLNKFYTDEPYEVKEYLTTIKNLDSSSLPNAISYYAFNLYSEVVEIPISNLENTLSVIETNTISTPYKIKITELTTTEIENKSIQYALTRNASKNKYVDLSETIIPSGVTALVQQFSTCITMIKSPKLPQGVVNLTKTYMGCYNLIEAPLIPDTVENMEYTFMDCHTGLVSPPVIPEGVTNLKHCFYNCRALLTPPQIPASATNITYMFYGCWALTQAPIIPPTTLSMEGVFRDCRALTQSPNIPPSVRYLTYCFYGCTSLTTFKTETFDSSIIISYNSVFGDCTNLTEFYCNTPYELKTWIDTIHTASSYNFPNDVANCHFYLYSEPAEISKTSFNNDLSALTANTVSTPFQIKVTGLTPQDVESSAQGGSAGTLGSFLIANPTKYVDLSETVMPNATNLTSTFENCVTLVDTPDLPNTVTVLDSTYKGCTNLTEAPAIPNVVTEMPNTFTGCLYIESVDNIPSGVTDLTECFKNCSALVEIEQFDVPLSVLKTNAQDCFDGCASLTTIGVQGVAPITEASEWHVIRLNFGANDVSGKVYDKDKNTTTIPQTTVQKGTLTLPIKTDELWFPPASMLDADIDAVIENVIDARLTYFNKPVLNPNNKSFVLWKGDNSNFVSNIDFGGGGGTDITVYDTLEDLEEDLPNHNVGDFLAVDSDYFIDKARFLDDVTTLAHDEIINILKEAVSVPIGTILSIPSSGVVSGYLQCNGSTFNELDYPLLYGALRTNILPKKWNAEEWVINQEILTEETFFGKPVYSFSFYDDRTRTTSWAVCTPNGETYFPYEHNIKKIVKVECSSSHNTTYRNGIVGTDIYQITNTTLDSTTQEYIPSATSQLYVYYGNQNYWSANDRVLRTIYYTKIQDDENRFSWKYIKAVSGVEEEESATVVNAIQSAEQALEQTVIDTADSIMATAIDNYFKEYVLAEATVTPTSGAQAVNANTVFNDSLLNYRTIRFYMKRSTGNTDYIPHYDVTHEEMVNMCARNTNYSLMIPGYSSEYREMTFNADGTVCTAVGGSECCYKVIGIGKLN